MTHNHIQATSDHTNRVCTIVKISVSKFVQVSTSNNWLIEYKGVWFIIINTIRSTYSRDYGNSL